MRRALVVLVGLALVGAALAGDDDPVEERIRDVAKLVAARPSGTGEVFAKSFLAAVPLAKLEEILCQLHEQGGKVVSVKRLSGDTLTGKYELEQAKGTRLEVTIGVEAKEPHKVNTLYFKPLATSAT